MRRTVVEVLALVVALMVVGLGYGQPSSQSEKPTDPRLDEKKPAKKSLLEEMLEQALRNNPDIKVAEAKLHEAEAELNRARLAVTQKVATLYAALDSARKGVEVAEAERKRVDELYKAGSVPQGTVLAAHRTLALAKAELAKAEAEVPYLLGKQVASDDVATRRALADWLMKDQRDVRERRSREMLDSYYKELLAHKTSGPMSERIRKALDSKVTLNYRGKIAESVLTDLFKKADVPVHVRVKLDGAIDLESKEALTLGAALQMFQDFSSTPVVFVVRDYGILVTDSKSLPANAVQLHDFWRSDAGKTKIDETGKNAPKERVEGLVRDVDKDGLIKISIGSDAGLVKGHTLEIYRLNDKEAKYLGTVKILDVDKTSAVAQPVGKLGGTVKVGDKVASRIMGN